MWHLFKDDPVEMSSSIIVYGSHTGKSVNLTIPIGRFLLMTNKEEMSRVEEFSPGAYKGTAM